MSVAFAGGVTLTAEAAFSAAVGDYGAWDSGIWDTSTWGPDDVFVDISAYLRSFSTSREFGREVQAWQAGEANLILNDRDGRFSPENLASPYVTGGVTGLRPWRPVRLRAAYAGITYDLYRGYAKDYLESWVPAGPDAGDAITRVPCADEWARLSAYKGLEVTPVGAGESFGARVHRLLNAAGHTGTRAIDVGSNTMQATDLSSDTTSELELVAESEGGAVYVGADGTVIGSRQYGLVEESRSTTSQATFGDGGGSELSYRDPQMSSSGDLLVNIVSYERVGGSPQMVADQTSRALYGDRRDPRTDLVCESDAQARQLASWKLARFKAPERRITQITIDPVKNPSVLMPVALGLRVRDLVTVIRRPPGGHTITQLCHIAGIEHEASATQWQTTFKLWSANPYAAFASSLWDTGVWDSSLWFY